jgi:hypothetical protein
MRSIARSFFGVAGLAFLSSCDALTGNKEKSISLDFPNTSLSVGQGSRDSVQITINRSNFDQPVTFSIEGTLPEGVTATFSPNPVQPGNTTTKLRVSANRQAVPGNATFAVVAKGEGIADKGQEVAVSITLTGTYTLSLVHPTVTVAQDGGAQTVAVLARTEGNASSVNLTTGTVPSGLTVSFESPVTGSGSGLNVTANGSVPPGTYPITITSQAAGFTSDQSVQLSVVVIPPPSTATISLPFCTLPNWFAFRNEGGTWQRVMPSGNSFTFAASARVAVAFVQQFSNAAVTNVFFYSRDGLPTGGDCGGTKSPSGTVAGLAAGQQARIALGGAFASTTTTGYTLQNVATGPLDLIATRATPSSVSLVADKVIVRRAQDYSTTIPELDFNAVEAVAPASHSLTVTGFTAGHLLEYSNVLATATSTFLTLSAGLLTGGSSTFQALPAGSLIATDLHELSVSSEASDFSAGQALFSYFGAPGDRTETMGPALGTPTLTVPVTAPFARPRGQFASQPEYPNVGVFAMGQGTTDFREIYMFVSASYLGGTPTTWDLLYPDFSNVAGFNTAWAPVAGQPFVFYGQAFAAPDSWLFGELPNSGEIVRYAYRFSETGSSQAASARASVVRPRPLLSRQYFRR